MARSEHSEGGEEEPPVTRRDIPALRLAMAAQGGDLTSIDLASRDFLAGEVPLRLYLPGGSATAGEGPPPLLLFAHGGGWVLGNLDTHDACCRRLCSVAGCAVLAVGYRLAPEHPFPAGLDDVRAAYRWARENAASIGCDPERVAIGGESAGANLVAALVLLLRAEGEAQPLFQLLVHPPTDLRLEQPSIDRVKVLGITRQFLELCVACYAGDTPPGEPLLSPLRAPDLSVLAPAAVLTVEHDPLRDDGEQYALALARAGNEVLLRRLPGLSHGFMFLPADRPGVADAYRLLGVLVARYFRCP